MILRTLNLALNDDGTVRGCLASYVEVDASGRETPVGTRRLREADLAAALPDHAAVLAQVDALIAERDDLTRRLAAVPEAGEPGTVLPKGMFCIRVMAMGLLTPAEAIAAARGEWPASFASAVASLSDAARAQAEITWAAATHVHRDDPLLAQVADAAGLTGEQLDALFAA